MTSPIEPPATPLPARPFGRRLSDITAVRDLTNAEKVLLAACRKGEVANLGQVRPKKATDDNTIHADLLRFLILGGDEENPVHETGVQLQGGWVKGMLNLNNIETNGNIDCKKCHFNNRINLEDAKIAGLYLDGSLVSGVDGDGLRSRNGVHLRDKFVAKGEVRLLVAWIDGAFDCSDGKFFHRNKDAVSCDGMIVMGNVTFRNINVLGKTSMSGSRIEGDFDCSGSNFDNENGYALLFQRVTIRGGMFSRNGTLFNGIVDFSASHVGSLVDEHTCWPERGRLVLDGLRYERFSGIAPTTSEARINWLERQNPIHLSGEFRSQPWRQAIKVLREMGHYEEARKLALRFHAIRYNHRIHRPIGWALHRLHGALFGFGLRPLYALFVHVGIALFFGAYYHFAATQGVFAPSNPLVFQNPIYARCSPDSDPSKLPVDSPKIGNWYWCPDVPAEYTTFQPYWYSLDVILPVIDLQQEKDWAPMIDTPPAHANRWAINNITDNLRSLLDFSNNPLRALTRILIWIEALYGWIAGVVFVSMLTGIGQRNDKD